jgi:hypothetical protein
VPGTFVGREISAGTIPLTASRIAGKQHLGFRSSDEVREINFRPVIFLRILPQLQNISYPGDQYHGN